MKQNIAALARQSLPKGLATLSVHVPHLRAVRNVRAPAGTILTPRAQLDTVVVRQDNNNSTSGMRHTKHHTVRLSQRDLRADLISSPYGSINLSVLLHGAARARHRRHSRPPAVAPRSCCATFSREIPVHEPESPMPSTVTPATATWDDATDAVAYVCRRVHQRPTQTA